MSTLDSSNSPKFNSGKLAKNVSDSTGLTDKLNQKLEEAAAPFSEAVDKARETADKIQEGINQAEDTAAQVQDKLDKASKVVANITEPETSGYDFLNYTITPPEELEKQAARGINRYQGESHIVYSTVMIDGKEVLQDSSFTLSISQKLADHDQFQITCPSDAFNERDAYPLANTRNYLGKRATIQLKQFGETAYIFTGIITNITNKKIDGYSRIILSGHSPTILLENGLDCQSFEKKSLEQIVKESTSEYPSDILQWDVRPLMKDPLLYTVQYRESDFDFLKRLATRYGEWFYYNGQQVVFGPYDGDLVDMIEEQDVYEFELKMQLVPQKFTYVGYDARQGKPHTVNSDSVPLTYTMANPFQEHAIQASEEIFTKVPQSLYNQSLLENGEMELKEAVKRQKQSRQNVFYLEAKSRNPNLKLGDVVKLQAWMPGNTWFKNPEVPLESYRIIKVSHHYNGVDGYYNTFTGIPRDNLVPPYMNEDALPECEEQSATVTDNNDPQGISRIRVQFPWQKATHGQSPWIRVTTPYAGKGKGMHVIPEIGEEVMVGFENGNAEKPVVLGAMFNGQGKSGHGGAGNYNKGLQTSSGSKLMMNDQTGSVILADKGMACMNMNGAGITTIDSKDKIILTCGASTVEMHQDGTILINGKDIGVLGSTSIGVGIGSGGSVTSGIGIEATTLDIGSTTLTMSGKEANLGGAKVNIGGGSETNIASGTVKLN